MSIDIAVYVEEAGDNDSIKLYRDTTPDGDFSTLVTTESLVDGQEQYTITDDTGTVDSWYRYTLYDDDLAVESALSEPFRPAGVTLNLAIFEAATRIGAAFQGITTGAQDVSYLQDAVLRDQGVDPKFLEGAWIQRPNAADASDYVRRVARDGFDVDNGRLDPVRDWGAAPSTGETYRVFLLLPPYDQAGFAWSWARAVREALNEISYADQLDLGEGTSLWASAFNLRTFDTYIREEDIGRVLKRTTDGNGNYSYRDARKNGGFVEYRENGPDDLSIIIQPPPTTAETVIVEVNRRYATLYRPVDVTDCPLELIARAAAFKALSYLNRIQAGKYAQEVAQAAAEYDAEYAGWRVRTTIGGA